MSFSLTARSIELNGAWLTAKLLTKEGSWVDSALDLNKHIQNVDGAFDVTTTASGWAHSAKSQYLKGATLFAQLRTIQGHFAEETSVDLNLFVKNENGVLIFDRNCLHESLLISTMGLQLQGSQLAVPFYKPTKAKALGLDAKFQCYIRTLFSPTSIVQNIDPCVKKVDRFPSDSPLQSPYHWLIFLSNHPLERVNMLLRSFHGAQNLYVRGSILVVKCDQEGFAVPVSITDYALIERMVLDTLARAQLAD
ncbi:hypothetical protein MD484_g591, partial [Candolleomyces efflorescens]